MYLLIQSGVLPTYTWQSVAGVSGKGIFYPLSQIKTENINDGESVTGASISAFDSLIYGNNIQKLVDDAT